MYNKLIYVTLLAIAITRNVDCKRTRIKKLTSDTEESTPKPSVLTYSTFGFNDVGPFDGFVPTSPDYATFLTANKQESSTRLYAPAFPTSLDSSGFGENYGSSANEQLLQTSDEKLQTSMSKYPSGPVNFFTSTSFDNVNDPNVNKLISDTSYDQDNGERNSLIYGAKLNSKQRSKFINDYNNSDNNASKTETYNVNSNTYSRPRDTYISSEHKQSNNELNNNYQSLPKYTTTTVASPQFDNIFNTPTASAIKFPRVIDFTNMNPYFSINNNIDNRFPTPAEDINSISTDTKEKVNMDSNNNYLQSDFNKNNNPITHFKYNNNNFDADAPKNVKDLPKFNYISNQEFSQNYFNNKNKLKGKYSFNSDKTKKPWEYSNKNEEVKSPIQYEYTTNHSTTSNKYENPSKRPFNSSIDEIAPASSNLDFYNYQHPETDFGIIKNYPSIKSPLGDNDNTGFDINYVEKIKPLDIYQNSFKNIFTTPPTATSHWGNLFKETEFSSHKTHFRRPSYQEENDDIVHIPKRPSTTKYGSQYDPNPFSDWHQTNSYKPYTQSYKQHLEWPKENNRYKSEEDLLGLRNHDLTHASYPPSFKHGYNRPPEDFDYKKLVDKWRNSYLKSKHKDSFREYETYASETKPIHVPVPKPYPIEVPHPVIVPVPQPYPVHVPVPKPVAVPVIREITLPIEKPVPYPVYKKVPYPVEKLVPVPVEKQVNVPVMKPYPVAVPQVRPLFHHTRTHDERDPDFDDDDDYQPRPESSKRIPNVKRPKNKRHQVRRPSRMTYQDRDKRRGPQRRPPSKDQRYNRHSYNEHRRPHRHHDNEYEDYEPNEYVYCKRTGNC